MLQRTMLRCCKGDRIQQGGGGIGEILEGLCRIPTGLQCAALGEVTSSSRTYLGSIRAAACGTDNRLLWWLAA